MADQDYNRAVGGTNWWDSSSARPATGSSSLPAASTSCSAVVFPEDQAASVMGLGLSSHPPVDHWNHPALIHRTDKGGEMGGGFRSMLQEGMGFGSSHTQKLFLGSADEASPEFKPIKGFSLDQFSHTSSVDSCSQGLASPSFLNPLDSSSYGSPTSSILQGLMGAPDQHAPQQGGGYGYSQGGYGMATPGNQESLMGSGDWSSTTNKVADHDFLKGNSMVDPNKFSHGSFWNMAAAAASSMADVPRPAATFFPGASPPLMQPHQMNIPCFDEKPQHNVMEVRDTSGPGRKTSVSSEQTTTSAAATTSTGGTTKRSRNEASSTLPPFKVRKEKMGDRITALQQLVSPFGKTDTASVLSEAIEYIKFLHDQVNVLSAPYLKSGASLQHQQSNDKSKDPEGPRQDLRSRGLCLVPVSSTFPVAHETTVDFWTPTFGGTFK